MKDLKKIESVSQYNVTKKRNNISKSIFYENKPKNTGGSGFELKVSSSNLEKLNFSDYNAEIIININWYYLNRFNAKSVTGQI